MYVYGGKNHNHNWQVDYIRHSIEYWSCWCGAQAQVSDEE